MGQVTLYLDEETQKQMRAAAKREGVSMSSWLAKLVKERTRSQWPEAVVQLAGAWKDLPTAEELRAGQPEDSPREAL